MRKMWSVAVGSSVVLLLVAISLPRFSRTLLFESFLLVTAGIALASLLPDLSAGRYRRSRRWWWRRPDPTTLPGWLLRHEGLVVGATRDTLSADGRLLAELRGLAAERLASKHKVDMAQDQDGSRALLGPAAWDLLRPDWAAGRSAWDPGPTLEEIDSAVSAIEGL